MMEKLKEKQIDEKPYISPALEVEILYMEYSIAAQSATVNITGGAANNQPNIDDWTDKGTTGDGNAEF